MPEFSLFIFNPLSPADGCHKNEQEMKKIEALHLSLSHRQHSSVANIFTFHQVYRRLLLFEMSKVNFEFQEDKNWFCVTWQDLMKSEEDQLDRWALTTRPAPLSCLQAIDLSGTKPKRCPNIRGKSIRWRKWSCADQRPSLESAFNCSF